MSTIRKAFVWGRLGEYAIAIAEDEKQPLRKREKASQMAQRFYNRAFELLESEECLWSYSSTTPEGKYEMPWQCQQKGCKGVFKKGEQKPWCFFRLEERR